MSPKSSPSTGEAMYQQPPGFKLHPINCVACCKGQITTPDTLECGAPFLKTALSCQIVIIYTVKLKHSTGGTRKTPFGLKGDFKPY